MPPAKSEKRQFMSWLDDFNGKVGSLSGVLILVMVLVVTIDALGRKIFAVTVPGATEFNTLLLVVLIYLGLAGTQARFAHFSVEALVGLLPPNVARWIAVVTTVLSLLFVGIIGWLSGRLAWNSVATGEISFGIIAFPIWPSRIAIAVGLLLLFLQLLVQLVRLFSADYKSPSQINASEASL